MTDFLPDNVNAVISKSTPFPSRFGKPEEFSQLVQQVIENKMINGEVIRLDGGLRPNKKFWFGFSKYTKKNRFLLPQNYKFFHKSTYHLVALSKYLFGYT